MMFPLTCLLWFLGMISLALSCDRYQSTRKRMWFVIAVIASIAVASSFIMLGVMFFNPPMVWPH